MSQMVLVLIHLLLTSGNICKEHEERFYFWLFMEDLSFPFFFYPHEAKERIKKCGTEHQLP